MFDTYYPYRKINHRAKFATENYSVIEHNYCFIGPARQRYLVIVEQYDYDVCVPKFYLQCHKSCAHKFQRMSQLGQANKVITTVLKITKEVTDAHPYASIAFNGANCIDEGKDQTKRFKTYSKIVEALISPVLFTHIDYKQQSCYLLLNKLNPDLQVVGKIEAMFNDIYDFASNN